MTLKPRLLASLDACFRPAVVRLPPRFAVSMYSKGRRPFLAAFVDERPERLQVPEETATILWGLRFRSPILNAAGMWKDGSGHRVSALQGAGGFLVGTTTASARTGNVKEGIEQPFAPYPRSKAASNWLGLPNPGHRAVAERLRGLARVDGFPVGASLGADPDPELTSEQKLDGLIKGMEVYDGAGVDFLEINESCPNTEAEASSYDELNARLERMAEDFLEKRRRPLPVVVKFSNDTETAQVPRLLDTLLNLGFDGVNFGNTSVDYARIRGELVRGERKLFDFFVDRFGGGVSGLPVKASSLRLVSLAAEHLRSLRLDREFHVIRTGGVETAADVRASLDAGASLVQWYTGYFEAFARHGHELYGRLYDGLV